MFYDLFSNLCIKKGVSPSKACIDMGLSRSLAAKWKNTKATPSADVIAKIADYFGVSAGYLLGREEKTSSKDVTDSEIKFALFGDPNFDDEDFEDVKRYAQFVAQRNKEKK